MKRFFAENIRILTLILICCVYFFVFIYFQTFDTAWINPHIGFPVATGDSSAYFALAKGIQNFHHFSYSTETPFIPESFRSPGYPAFIALILSVTHNQGLIAIIQLLLALLTGWFIFDIVKTNTTKTIAWVASLFFIFNPSTLFYSITLLSDVLFTFLLTACVWLLYKKKSLLYHYGAFFLLGISTLVRPAASYMLIIFALSYVLMYYKQFGLKKILATCFLLCLTTSITLVPWMYRNYAEYNSFSVSSIGPYTLLFFDMEEFKIHQGINREVIEATWLNELNLSTKDEAYNPLYSQKISAIFMREFLSSPLQYSLFHMTGSARLFIVSSISDTLNSMHRAQTIIGSYHADVPVNISQWFERIVLLLLTGLLFISPIISYRNKDSYFGIICFAVSICIYTALIIGPIPNARYRLSLLPFLLIGASYSFFRLSKHKLFIQKVAPHSNNSGNNNLG